MSEKHLDPRLFDRLLRGRASAEEVRELAWHLVEACPTCARVAEYEWAISEGAEDTSEVEAPLAEVSPQGERISFDRIRNRLRASIEQIDRQKEAAPALLDELVRHPIERQRLLVRNNPRYHSAPFAELLLEQVWQDSFEDPAAAVERTSLVLEVIDRIDGGLVGEEVLNDLRGRVWAFRGNFLRVVTDFRLAEAAFSKADDFFSKGTGDLLERARLLGFWSFLRILQFRPAEGREMAERGISIYLATGEQHLAGRMMINQAMALKDEGEPQQATSVLRKAVGMIDREREPHLVLVAKQNLMSYLAEMGKYDEALSLLPLVRRMAVETGRRGDLLRIRWLEGRILLGLGHEARAEAALLEVRKGFTEQGLGYSTASVSLELAALYLRQGRTAEIKQLAAEMVPIFESRDVHREALAALMLFKKAVEMETVSVRLVEEVASLIRRSQGRPRPVDERPS